MNRFFVVFSEVIWERFCGWKRNLAVIFLIYISLASSIALVQRPNDEEMLHADIGYTVLKEGRVACPIWDWAGLERWKRYDERFYSMPPGAFYLLAGWFKVWGFGLFQLRFFSVFWGVVALWFWIRLLGKLGVTDRRTLAIAGLLIGTDFIFVRFSAGRPYDILITALNAAALYLYLCWREKSLHRALFFSQCIAVAACIVHPNGLLIVLELLFLTLVMDLKNLRWEHLFSGSLPYLAGGMAMLWHIFQDFDLFVTQFFANVEYSGHTGLRNKIWGTIRSEFLLAYGFTTDVPAVGKLLVAILFLYASSVIVLFLRRWKEFPAKIILCLIGIHLLFLTFVLTHKWPHYVTLIIPLLGYSAAMAASHFLDAFPNRKWIIFSLLSMMILLSLGATGYRLRRNDYWKKYRPDIEAARRIIPEDGKIFANAEVAFGLGLNRVLHDSTLGYFNHQKRPYLLVDDLYETLWKWYSTDRPYVYAHVAEALKNYKLVYQGNFYKIYQQKS
ncbi:MAG: glycosyltransferase family 39 protein [Elusimicrobia bacterium]|nr:glycosyltransferase family 39 protein [Elusimicrobiota bacterium]